MPRRRRHAPKLTEADPLATGRNAGTSSWSSTNRESGATNRNRAPTARRQTTGKRHQRTLLQSLFRGVLIIVLFLIAIPLLLTPSYHFFNPPSTTMISQWIKGRPVDQQWLAIDDISDRLKVSVITAEDARFCDHHGVDFEELKNVVDDFKAGERTRGASTISMQLAKNLFLWNSRSYARKAIEIPLALYIDLVLGKRRMFEIYLNIAEWGPGGRFGVDAGARHFFKQPATALTWRKATLLATMLPSPYRRNAASPSTQHSQVATVVQKRAQAASSLVSCLR